MPGPADQPDWMPFAMPEHVLAPPVRRYVPPPRPTAPATVSAAATLMIFRAVLIVLALGALYASRDTWQAQLQQQYPLASPDSLNSVITNTLMTTAPFTLLSVVVYLARSARVRRGGDRARFVTMVFATIAIATACYSLSRQVPMLYKVVLGVDVMLDAAIIALLAMPASAAWCRRRRC